MTPRPPVTVRRAGGGQVLVAGAPRTALQTVVDGTGLRWDAQRRGWLLPAEHAAAVVDWARRAGRGVEITEEVRRDD
jgi:hypothetical protein